MMMLSYRKVASFWSKTSGTSESDAFKTLTLLRDLFKQCARPVKNLVKSDSLLERRIGLIEVHANREAAHLSIEPYLFSLADMAHVVAAIALISTMIYDFDNA